MGGIDSAGGVEMEFLDDGISKFGGELIEPEFSCGEAR